METIYVVGSLQEIDRIKKFTARLAQHDMIQGYDIFIDWTGHGATPDVEFTKFAKEMKWSYSRALASPVVRAVFEVDKKMIMESVAVIMIQPCGKSAATELGFACCKNKVSVIIKDGPEYSKIEVMELFADILCNDVEDFFNNHIQNFFQLIKARPI